MKPGYTNDEFYFILPVLTHVIGFLASFFDNYLLNKIKKFSINETVDSFFDCENEQIKCCIAARQCVLNVVPYFDLYGGLIYP